MCVCLGTTDPTAFNPRQKTILPGSEEDITPSGSIWEQFKDVLQSRPFWYVIGIYLCSWLSFQLTAAIIPYYAVSYMGMDSYFPVALVVQGTAMLALSLWSWVSYRYGRKRTYFAGMIGWIVAQILLFFLPSDRVDLLYILCFMAGLGVSTAYLIPWSILTDVTDLDELNTGEQRQGTFYALMVFLQKNGFGVRNLGRGDYPGTIGFCRTFPWGTHPPTTGVSLICHSRGGGPPTRSLPAHWLALDVLLSGNSGIARNSRLTPARTARGSTDSKNPQS